MHEQVCDFAHIIHVYFQVESFNITPKIGLHDSADTQESDTESVTPPPYSPISVTTCEEMQDHFFNTSYNVTVQLS